MDVKLSRMDEHRDPGAPDHGVTVQHRIFPCSVGQRDDDRADVGRHPGEKRLGPKAIEPV